MNKLIDFEKQFARNHKDWTKAQWRSVALTLLGIPSPVAKRGRPRQLKLAEQKPALSAVANYQALAHQVCERMKETGATEIKKTVREIMLESWCANRAKDDDYDKREGLVDSKLEAAYTAVRKILRHWADK